MKTSANLLRGATAAFAMIVTGADALAAPTPVPGGANQLTGISGGLSGTLFNGKMRLRGMRLRAATADEASPSAGQTAIALTYLISNGTSKQRAGNVTASIADADGVAVNGRSTSVYSALYSLQPGMPARGTIAFVLPPGFVPVKILLTDGSGPAFRITLKPSDIPAPARPATPAPAQ